jgi:hypothetical protein
MSDPCRCGQLDSGGPKGRGKSVWLSMGWTEVGRHVWRKEQGECRQAEIGEQDG